MTHAGFPAYEMESEDIRLTVVPELGAKIVSLLYKPTNKEWLIGPEPRTLRAVPYGADFEAADFSGWDECFPTIVACDYPAEGAYRGTSLPDHGELWSIPWAATADDVSVICSVQGRALPYSFARTIRFAGEGAVRFEYSVTNAGSEPLSMFWCAHPMFAATEHTSIVFPGGTDEVLCVDGGLALAKGRTYAWPQGDGALGRPLDEVGPVSNRDSRKFYVDGPVAEGRGGLLERDTGEFLELFWNPDELPYFGVWVNEGRLAGKAIVAVEPCNGFYDGLDIAYATGACPKIAPGATLAWRLDVQLGSK